MDDANLIRLLKLTAGNKSVIVQALRKEIVKCLNGQEVYISELEIENFQLVNFCIKYDICLSDLKRVFINMANKTEPEKCIFNPKYKILFETPTYLA